MIEKQLIEKQLREVDGIKREIARMEGKTQELSETLSGLRRRTNDPEQALGRVIIKLNEAQESLQTARHFLSRPLARI